MIKFLIASGLIVSSFANAQTIGSVDTDLKLFGKNSKIEITAFDDPKVKGVTCYISRPVKGGLTGAIGMASEASDSSIACRSVGKEKPVIITAFNNGESVFSEDRNIFFREMKVVRFYDPSRNVIIYITNSKGLVEGSPKHSITAVPLN